MSGKRIKDLESSQGYFLPEIVVLVDKLDTGSGDWLFARKMPIGLLGNTRFQGSINGVNWHDDITSSDSFMRFSSDGGTTWKNLNTSNIKEGTNLYFTEARVLAVPAIATIVANSHEHADLAAVEKVIDNGAGNLFLADDGTYRAFPAPNIVTKSGLYSLSSSDNFIFLDGTGLVTTIFLPSATDNDKKQYSFKCINDTYTCSVSPNGGYIDNSTSSVTLSLMESLTVIAYNNKWWII